MPHSSEKPRKKNGCLTTVVGALLGLGAGGVERKRQEGVSGGVA